MLLLCGTALFTHASIVHAASGPAASRTSGKLAWASRSIGVGEGLKEKSGLSGCLPPRNWWLAFERTYNKVRENLYCIVALLHAVGVRPSASFVCYCAIHARFTRRIPTPRLQQQSRKLTFKYGSYQTNCQHPTAPVSRAYANESELLAVLLDDLNSG